MAISFSDALWYVAVYGLPLFIVIRVINHVVRLLTPAPEGKEGEREFGNFEYVLEAIVQTCGHHNISAALHFQHRLNEDVLREALRRLQRRMALLRCHVVYESGIPHFRLLQQDKDGEYDQIPMRRRVTADALLWKDLLQREMNMGFPDAAPLVRCVLLVPSERDDGTVWRHMSGQEEVECGSALILTVRHDLMDGKSGAILFGELVADYARAYSERFPEMKDLPPNEMGASTRSRDTVIPIGKPVDCLLPRWLPTFIPFLAHLASFLWKSYFFLSVPDKLPRTAVPHVYSDEYDAENTRRGRWETGLVHRSLSKDETQQLLRHCKVQKATVGCFMFAVMNELTAERVMEHRRTDSAVLWGHMLVDMRPTGAMRRELIARDGGDVSTIFDPHGIGVYISTVDFRHVLARRDLNSNGALWEHARSIRRDLIRGFGLLQHLTGIVFVRAMASFSALCSYYFIHPHPAPSFTMSNLGDVKSSMIGHHLTHFPFLRDIHVGVTSGTSFPMPMCTAMTVKGELRVTISFPRDTVAEEFGIKFADDLMDRLVRACA